MTFGELITEVSTGLGRFTTAQSTTQAPHWIQLAYGQLWGMEDWSFRQGVSTTVTATASTQQASNLPSDFGAVRGFWNAAGDRLKYLDADAFYDLYAATTTTGTPAHYSVINATVKLGPTPNVTAATYTMTYEKAPTQLTLTADVPTIPSEYHYLLVPGALCIGLALYSDFTSDMAKELWLTGIESMRKDYLSVIYGEIQQMGAYRPDAGLLGNRVWR